jgi:enoyl-CoA hydratase/carnithine racemase
MSASAPGRRFGDVLVSVDPDLSVAEVEIQRPPNNFFDLELVTAIADAQEYLEQTDECRAIVLCSQGKHFCAGASLADKGAVGDSVHDTYQQALRICATTKPVVAALQGASVGGGLGLALSADLRVGSSASRFTANFARLGFVPGFGLTVTLAEVVGRQRALELMYAAPRIDGRRGFEIGLLDRLVEPGHERDGARDLAAEIAQSAPLALEAISELMRTDRLARLRDAMAREASEQERLQLTSDFAEGVRAYGERRPGRFQRR